MASLVQIWHEREIQIVVLFSFMLQIFLLLTGGLRRWRYSSEPLRVMTWLAYLGADMVAFFAIGLFSQYEDGYKCGRSSYEDTLPFLWVPFLLVHLGGQDTITAFSIDDNNLWLRHLLNLIVEVTLAMYVFWKSKDRINWRLLRIAAYIFVTGIIKYGERVLALRGGSRDGLERPSGQKNEKRPSGQRNGNVNQVSSQESYALQVVLPLRGLFVGRTLYQLRDKIQVKSPDVINCATQPEIIALELRDKIQVKFPDDNSATQLEIIVLELGMAYDLLYTKAMVLQRWTGVIVRCVSQIFMVSAFVLFVRTEKHAHDTANVQITYILFVGAICMEACSVTMAMASPWIRAHLKKGNFLYRLSRNVLSRFTAKHWSSNSLGQFNLTDSSISEKSTHKWISKVVNAFGLEKYWRNFWHIKHIEDKDIIMYIVEFFGRITGTSRLMLNPELNYTLTLPFEHALFRLHIFTDLYISGLLQGGVADGDEMSLVQQCQKLSNYMIYLMAVHPSMLPVSSAAQDLEPSFAKWVKDCNCTAKLQILERYRDERLAHEVLLGSPFESLAQDETANSRRQLLDHIMELWVRVLVYAAGKCRGEVHARQLGEGEELLTSVWLLMMHHGYGDVAEEYNLLASNDSTEMPTPGSLYSVNNSEWLQRLGKPLYAFDFRQSSLVNPFDIQGRAN